MPIIQRNRGNGFSNTSGAAIGRLIQDARRRKQEEERRKGEDLQTLITSLSDPSMSEDEQAAVIKSLDIIPEENFKRQYGMTQSEFKSRLGKPSSVITQDDLDADPSLPPQSLQPGVQADEGKRIVRAGDNTPELRTRRAQADIAETRAEAGKVNLKLSQDQANRVNNQMIIRARTGSNRLSNEAGGVFTLAETKQILFGNSDDPAVQQQLERVQLPTEMDVMSRNFASIIPDEEAATPESKLALARQVTYTMQVKDPLLLSALAIQTKEQALENAQLYHTYLKERNEQAKTPLGMKPSDKERLRVAIDESKARVRSAMYGEGWKQYLQTQMELGPDGELRPVEQPNFIASFFGATTGGTALPQTDANVQLSNADHEALMDPTGIIGRRKLADLGMDPNVPVAEMLTDEHLAEVVKAIGKSRGVRIEGIRRVDKKGITVDEPIEALMSRWMGARQEIIPRRLEMEMGGAVEGQLQMDMDTIDEAARVLAGNQGLDDTSTDAAGNSVVDQFSMMVNEVIRQQNAQEAELTDAIREIKEQLGDIIITDEED